MRLPKNYPKSLVICDEEYKIRFLSRLRDNAYGECDPEKKELRIKKGISSNETLKTLIHEVLHAMEMEVPIKLKHSTIYQLEEAIFEFLVENFHVGPN